MKKILFLSLFVFAGFGFAESAEEYWPLKPFWFGGEMKSESVLFIKEANKATASAKLFFTPDEILMVKQPATGKVFKAGADYYFDKASGQLRLTAKSGKPFLKRSDFYKEPGSPRSIKACVDGKHHLLFGEGHLFHDLQIEVTYRHSDRWDGTPVSFAGDKLARTYGKLMKKERIKVVLFGDSISHGGNSSAHVKSKPFMPAYGVLVAEALRNVYGSEIDFVNLSAPGQVSAYGLKNIGEVIAESPDLVIIAWGMNDASHRVSVEKYLANIAGEIKAVGKQVPGAEFILVATSCANPEWTNSRPDYYEGYRDGMAKMCGDGVALADVTSVWTEVVKRKSYWDITNNGVNHANDFGHRIYAQTVLSLLVKDVDKLDAAVRCGTN